MESNRTPRRHYFQPKHEDLIITTFCFLTPIFHGFDIFKNLQRCSERTKSTGHTQFVTTFSHPDQQRPIFNSLLRRFKLLTTPFLSFGQKYSIDVVDWLGECLEPHCTHLGNFKRKNKSPKKNFYKSNFNKNPNHVLQAI